MPGDFENLDRGELPSQMSWDQMNHALVEIGKILPDSSAVLHEAAARVIRLDRLQRILGMLAPAGTAPRTALEDIYKRSAFSDSETQTIVEFRKMLEPHWGDWTPAIQKAEGLVPEE